MFSLFDIHMNLSLHYILKVIIGTYDNVACRGAHGSAIILIVLIKIIYIDNMCLYTISLKNLLAATFKQLNSDWSNNLGRHLRLKGDWIED